MALTVSICFQVKVGYNNGLGKPLKGKKKFFFSNRVLEVWKEGRLHTVWSHAGTS